MADVTVDITISLVSYKAWLTTSYIATAMVGESGIPLIVNNELSPDQVDFFENYMDEAAREVLKVFMSRQGDAAEVPFEKTSTHIFYRFAEATPVLTQAAAIKAALYEDVKNALFAYVTYLFLKVKKNTDQAGFIYERYQKLLKDIDINLYKLHD